MKTYFEKFPRIFYDIDGTGTNVQLVTDILHRAKFLKTVLNNHLVFYPYTVKDGETPEIIASKLYGSANYYWIVLYCNDIFSLWDEWPLSYDQMQAYLIAKYGSVETAQTTIDHYEDSYGNTIDLTTYNANVSYDWKLKDSYNLNEMVTYKGINYISLCDNNTGNLPGANSYYVDPINGNDNNSGLSCDCAWKTTTVADSIPLYAGQSIMYFDGTFWQLYAEPNETSNSSSLDTNVITRPANLFGDPAPAVWQVHPREGDLISSTIVYADQGAITANAIKAQIRLLDPSYVSQVDNQLDNLLVPVGS